MLDHTMQQLERGEIGAVEAIDALLSEEFSGREGPRVKQALRMARLSTVKTLSSFDFSFQPSLDRNRILSLAQLAFIERNERSALQTYVSVAAQGPCSAASKTYGVPFPLACSRSVFWERCIALLPPICKVCHETFGAARNDREKSLMWTTRMRHAGSRLAPLIMAGLAACGHDAPVQTGQIIGGATKQVTDVQNVRGFLPQPRLLASGAATQPALVYRNPAVDFSIYSKVMLAPVVIVAAPGSALNSVSNADRNELAARFETGISRALSQHCQLVSAPSPNTMLLHFALTDANQTDATINTVTTYTPYLSTAVSAAALVFNNGVGYFTGTASAEGYAQDALTEKLLWQGVDKRGGTGALVKNTFDNWLDVDNAMQAWSEKLASRLQQLGVCKS